MNYRNSPRTVRSSVVECRPRVVAPPAGEVAVTHD